MTVIAPDFARSKDFASRSTGGDVVPLVRLQRSTGEARLSFKASRDRTVLDELHQAGCCKIRFPRPEPGAHPEAVLLNTAGGLTDNDALVTTVTWRAGTSAVVTTQAAERIYKSRGEPAHITNMLKVGKNATALWLPQETILFDGGRFRRRLVADLAKSATLLACEATVFGRTAMGEKVLSGALDDSWRIRVGGRLVFADAIRLFGDIAEALRRPALANGAAAIASVICVRSDAEALVTPVRESLERLSVIGGCSSIGPVLVVRLLGVSGSELRHDLVSLLTGMLGHIAVDNKAPASLPRVWAC